MSNELEGLDFLPALSYTYGQFEALEMQENCER